MSRLLASVPVPLCAVLQTDLTHGPYRTVGIYARLLPLEPDSREAVIDMLDGLPDDVRRAEALTFYNLPQHDFLTHDHLIVPSYRSMSFDRKGVFQSSSLYHQSGKQHGLMSFQPQIYGQEPHLSTFGLRKGFLRKLYEENRFRPATEEDADPFNKKKLVICDLEDRQLMVPADENGVPLEIDDPNAREQDVTELFAANRLLGYDQIPSRGGFFYAPAAYF